MTMTSWDDIRDLEAGEDRLWELFHENSKITPYMAAPSNDQVLGWMMDQFDQFEFESRETVPLPPPASSAAALGEVIRKRRTPQAFTGGKMSLEQLSTLLFQSAGTTCDDPDSIFPRPFRAAPSAGAMFPLDLFVHVSAVSGLAEGLYHYDTRRHRLAVVRSRSCAVELQSALVQPELAETSCVIAMIVATFERVTQKYADRGLRFALLEGGHIAQNMLLTATSLDMAGIPLGGYFDRNVEAILGIDGVTHSIIYAIATGHPTIPG